ncbi:MAG: hypothetical protein HOM16_09515, partial [Woeseia sp.]|nr:hypothetical protein [Woeseia sp.]
MSSRLNRIWLLPLLLLGSQAWALGLGEIRLSSALNQPMYAEIELLSATPEELNNLTIQMASAETFDRYDLDRPLFLTRLNFEVVESDRVDGNVIRVTSSDRVSEPFITFLVEASWSRGRLLREYTLLLDPPTFAPPPVSQATQTVTAPSRATPSDAGQIRRAAPAPAPQSSQQTSRPSTQPVAAAPQNSGQNSGQPNFDATPGGGVVIQRGDTLWGITSRVRPDSRLTINQTMLAIYEANPQAFAGNINVMRAGATLRIPSADDAYRISRGQALSEVQRQNAAWGGDPGIAPDVSPSISEPDAQPSLTLVPPDDDISLTDDQLDTSPEELLDDVVIDPVDARINEIQALLEDQDSLIEISDNELAALRAELVNLRGEELPVDDTADDILTDASADETAVDDATDNAADIPPAVVMSRPQEKGIVDTILGYFSNVFALIGGLLVIVLGILVWFMRRAGNRDGEEATGAWEALDADEFDPSPESGTQRLQALAQDEDDSFLVEETEATTDPVDNELMVDAPAVEPLGDTVETSAPVMGAAVDPDADTSSSQSLEDTFSSDTAINLDQSDPVAEADFHMAYGLYDQAANLINGALKAEPEREDFLAKLCEIYFVWGNRDAFVDAAGNLKAVVGGSDNPDWDKIVIMGQQIAGEHEMFSGVSAEGVSRAVDLSFDGGMEDAGELDIDFAGGPDSSQDDVIDLGSDAGLDSFLPDATGELDFSFDEDADNDSDVSVTQEMEAPDLDEGTAEMPVMGDLESIAETPTIEAQFAIDATGELPALADFEIDIPATDATVEINLDDLGLDLGGLDETSVATDDELINDLDDTAESQSLQIPNDLDATGTVEELSDYDATGHDFAIDLDNADTGIQPAVDIEDALAATGEMPSLGEGTS